MALVLKDRVKEQSTTTGTGTFTLSGAYDGYQAFSVIGDGNVTYYTIYDPATGDWEVGYGTYTASGTTLSRTFVYDSSNSGNLVPFAAGTKEVFCTYPSEQAVYQETNGNLRLINGVIEVSIDGTSGTTLPNATFQAFSTTNGYIQNNIQNLSGGADASSDFVATNDQGTDSAFYADMGINSSGFNSATYPLYTPNSGYLYSVGDAGANPSTLFVGSGDGDVVLHAGGFTTAHVVGTASGTDQSMSFEADVNVGGALDVTAAAAFGSTVLLNQDPTLALQAATKQYVDQTASSGIHIHEPVRVEKGSNLTATYAQGGTTFNVTDISGGNTLTTSTTHGLSVNDQVWFTGTVGNGLSANVAYFVYSTPAGNQITLSTNFNGAQLTGLTNASGLTYPVRANSGEGATLTNSGAQAALVIDGVTVNTNDRVLVYGQTTAYQNGVYTVTNTGSGSTNWVLTRALDQDHYSPSDTNGMGAGDYFYVTSGATGAGESYVLTTTGEFIIGYDALTYTQFSGAVTYTGGTNIDVTGQTISLTGTVAATNGGTGTNTVTTGDLLYGSGTNAWSKLAAGGQYRVLTMGASTPEWNAVALDQANAVSGTLPESHGGTNQSSYATGDTLYASATNTLSKLSGNTATTRKFLSQTGTGSASQAPTWDTVAASDITSGTLAVARGGTGLSSYAVGDIVYASGTGTLAGLADAATGNVLLSGGTNTAPAYGKVGLGTHVSGTLPLANGGTGETSAQAAINSLAGAVTSGYYLRGNGTNVVMAAISAGDVPTLNQNTTGSAGSVANALTMNNGGAGDASGSTYNGSAARTISYNTIGASPLAGSTSLTTTGTVTTGTWSGLFGAVSGANLTNLTAGNLSGTIPSAVLGNSTLYVGTTAVALNRASANQGLTGITSIAMPGASSGTITITPAATAGTTALTIPANSGSFVTTGDTGTVTNTMLAGSIANAKLANSSVTINGSAVSLGGSITVTATATNALTIGSYLTGTSYNGSAAVTIAADATSANTASKLVARDASGNFSAGTITATLSGSATSATTATNLSGGSVAATTGTFSNYLRTLEQVRAVGWYGTPTGSSYTGLGVEMGVSGGQGYIICYNRDTSAYGALNLQGTAVSITPRPTFNGNTAIDTANYNSYSPTLTGTGASGTWGINISGTATNQSGGTVSATTIDSTQGVADVSGTSSALRIVNPGGASYAGQDSALTGAIKITLPQSWTNTMMRMTIRVYTYDNLSYDIYCGGYNYAGTYWVNTFAYMGTQSRGALNVRFGHDGTKCCIYIGETATVWSYPQVFVTDFEAGFSNYAASQWRSGWSAGFTTTLGTITATQTAAVPLNGANYNSYAPTLTGTGASGTWGINISGNAATATTATNWSGIPAGTVMLFRQTAAPTGWTKDTTNYDGSAIRVVTGTVSSGGSVAFTTAFASQSVAGTVAATTLAESQIPSHRHQLANSAGTGGLNYSGGFIARGLAAEISTADIWSSYTGGGTSHTHSFTGTAINLAVKYVDCIFATKN